MRLMYAAAAFALAIICVSNTRADQPDNPSRGSSDFLPTPDRPMGWRGDGTGRFPAADPPRTWGRISKAVMGLSTQARKPKPDDRGKPMPEGVIRDWLTLGPVPIPEGKAAKSDFGTDEAKLEPNAGDRLGGLDWKAVTLDNPYLDFRPMYNLTAKDREGFVAYAHTWIHSAEGKPVFLNIMLSGTAKVWVNGKDLGGFVVSGLQSGLHLELPLEKGWNRLLLRVAPQDDLGWSKGVVQWHFNAAFFGTEKSDYESRNIVWSTPMFDHGPGVGSPILVGDKLFVPAEAGVLLCVSAKDGKVLWARSTTYADAATPGERKENPEVFAEADTLTAEINGAIRAYCESPDKYVLDTKAREEVWKQQKKINTLLKKVSARKYPGQSGGEAGEAAATPVSDGQFVYALYAPGVVACFDLAGNRIWTTVLDLRHPEHSYGASPCLIDGKLVVKVPGLLGAVALDGKTGEVAMSMPLWKAALHSYTSPLPLAVGGESLIVQSCGVITRAKDGKVLAKDFMPPYYNWSDIASPTFEGRTVCSSIIEKKEGNIRFGFQTLPDSIADPVVMKDTRDCEFDVKAFPCWFGYNHIASPLLYQGLAYCLSVDGVLTVIDAAKGEVVYQKMLDLSPLMRHGPDIIRAGCSGSPTLGGKHIYVWDNQGTTLVIEPGRTFKLVARNRLEQLFVRWGAERNECTISNPIFSGRRMFYRGEINLYCIGETDK